MKRFTGMCLTALFITILLGCSSLLWADNVDVSKEKSFGVSEHTKALNAQIFTWDGFLFHRYPNSVTKKIDSSEGITFTYTIECTKIDFATMKKTVLYSKTTGGSIAAGKNEFFLDATDVIKEWGAKTNYTGQIGCTIKESKGANAVGIGAGIDLRLVKVAMDNAALYK